MKHTRLKATFLVVLVCILLMPVWATAEPPNTAGDIKISVPEQKGELAGVIKILLAMTFLSVVPAILFTTTSFTRIIIVLSFARQAFGVQNLPPNQVLIGLALFLTVFVMTPVWEEVDKKAYQPYQQGEITYKEAGKRTIQAFRTFMLKHTREKDLALMLYLSKKPLPKTEKDIPTTTLIPAFILSELTLSFQMGFLLLLPFLVIDIIISSTLLAMGMIMLPPVVISVPFKVLLFILVDGWHLVVKTLVLSYA